MPRVRQVGDAGLGAPTGQGRGASADFSACAAAFLLLLSRLPGLLEQEGGAWIVSPKL